jgi:hypothetical protein
VCTHVEAFGKRGGEGKFYRERNHFFYGGRGLNGEVLWVAGAMQHAWENASPPPPFTPPPDYPPPCLPVYHHAQFVLNFPCHGGATQIFGVETGRTFTKRALDI